MPDADGTVAKRMEGSHRAIQEGRLMAVSGKALTPKQIAALRRDYLKGESMKTIGRKHGVQDMTVARYRDLEDWDGMRQEIQAVAREKIIQRLGESSARDVEVIDKAISLMVRGLEEQEENSGILAWNAADLERLIRARQLLTGQPTERRQDIVLQLGGSDGGNGASPDGHRQALRENIRILRDCGFEIGGATLESLLAEGDDGEPATS